MNMVKDESLFFKFQVEPTSCLKQFDKKIHICAFV
jgi:hypothetical protein